MKFSIYILFLVVASVIANNPKLVFDKLSKFEKCLDFNYSDDVLLNCINKHLTIDDLYGVIEFGRKYYPGILNTHFSTWCKENQELLGAATLLKQTANNTINPSTPNEMREKIRLLIKDNIVAIIRQTVKLENKKLIDFFDDKIKIRTDAMRLEFNKNLNTIVTNMVQQLNTFFSITWKDLFTDDMRTIFYANLDVLGQEIGEIISNDIMPYIN